jgi:hypothetical protein
MQGINEKYRQIFVRENQLHNKGLQPSIITVTKWKRMRWAGYVARMGDKNSYRLPVANSEGKRPPGRLGCRWYSCT